MNNKKVFQKIIFIGLIVIILFALVAPAIFSQTMPAPKQEKLLNGLKILLWPDTRANKVSVRIRVHAGSAFDPQGKEGVMQLLADNIFPNEASREFFTEDLGGGLEVVSNYDYIEINASSRPDGFLSMLETLSAAIAFPAIEKETTVKLRTALAAKAAVWETEPAYVADRAVAKRLLGTFPYGRPEDGDTESLKKIDFADLIDAKGRFLSADNATIAVSGNFDRALGFRAIRRFFGSWLKSDKKVPSTFRQPDEPSTSMLSLPSPNPDTAAVRFAMRGVARKDNSYVPSMVFAAIIENRLRSRLPEADSEGLFVRNNAHILPGIITIGFSAGKGDIGSGYGKMNANNLIGKAISDPITEAEFVTAKRQIQTAWLKKPVSDHWLDMDTYKLTSAEADARSADNVTLADVNAFAKSASILPVVTVLLTTPAAK